MSESQLFDMETQKVEVSSEALDDKSDSIFDVETQKVESKQADSLIFDLETQALQAKVQDEEGEDEKDTTADTVVIGGSNTSLESDEAETEDGAKKPSQDNMEVGSVLLVDVEVVGRVLRLRRKTHWF